jgi:hypothetical protein
MVQTSHCSGDPAVPACCAFPHRIQKLASSGSRAPQAAQYTWPSFMARMSISMACSCCVVVLGRSDGPGGVIGTTVRLMSIELWLQALLVVTDRGEVVHRLDGGGMIVTEHPTSGGKRLLVQCAGSI